MRTHIAFVLLVASALIPPMAIARQHAYPAEGQSAQKQRYDEEQCDAWAKDQSGYDPANPPQAAYATPGPVTGSGTRVRGAVAGAAIGAAGGNDVGHAAAKGAVAGGIVQRSRNRRAAAAANQATEQQISASEDSYFRARRSCLEGRGYTVN